MRGMFVVLLCFGVETGRDPNGASNVTAQDLSVLSSQVITRSKAFLLLDIVVEVVK